MKNCYIVMAMKAHQQRILDECLRFGPREKALFPLLLAERLRSCCWACQAGHGIDLGAFFTHLDALFATILSKESPDADMLGSVVEELESTVPTGGEPLLVQGQSGVICLLSAFDTLAGGSRVTLVDSMHAIVDALNNYQFFIRRRITNDISTPARYSLLQREIDRQLADVAFIKGFHQLDKSSVAEYRLENLQFAVPIAV